jgi:Dopey, N-terminal
MHKKQLSKINLMKIMTVILHSLLKRDMSLNRRIYAWFLGTNDSCTDITNQQNQINDLVDSSSYFIRYTREILIESLRNLLDTISKNAILTNIKSNEDENKQMTDIIDSLPSTWTLTKLIRVLLVLGR